MGRRLTGRFALPRRRISEMGSDARVVLLVPLQQLHRRPHGVAGEAAAGEQAVDAALAGGGVDAGEAGEFFADQCFGALGLLVVVARGFVDQAVDEAAVDAFLHELLAKQPRAGGAAAHGFADDELAELLVVDEFELFEAFEHLRDRFGFVVQVAELAFDLAAAHGAAGEAAGGGAEGLVVLERSGEGGPQVLGPHVAHGQAEVVNSFVESVPTLRPATLTVSRVGSRCVGWSALMRASGGNSGRGLGSRRVRVEPRGPPKPDAEPRPRPKGLGDDWVTASG